MCKRGCLVRSSRSMVPSVFVACIAASSSALANDITANDFFSCTAATPLTNRKTLLLSPKENLSPARNDTQAPRSIVRPLSFVPVCEFKSIKLKSNLFRFEVPLVLTAVVVLAVVLDDDDDDDAAELLVPFTLSFAFVDADVDTVPPGIAPRNTSQEAGLSATAA